MAIPNAPCSLEQQTAAGSNVVVTVVLQGLGRDFNPGTTFNSGNPTATFTIAVPKDAPGVVGGSAGEGGNSWQDIIAQVELAWREGSATVA